MNETDPAFIRRKLSELRIEHRELDSTIVRVLEEGLADELEVRRMKKRKLQLRDYIATLESRLIPDIDA